MMKCKKCGTEVSVREKFCRNCGTKVANYHYSKKGINL